MQYRAFARIAGMLMLGTLVSASAPRNTARDTEPAAGTVTVFKDANCGCCKSWIEHLREHAFEVVAKDTSDVAAVKRTGRVPTRLYSCHTAFVDGYVIEGHVPAADVKRLLSIRLDDAVVIDRISAHRTVNVLTSEKLFELPLTG